MKVSKSLNIWVIKRQKWVYRKCCTISSVVLDVQGVLLLHKLLLQGLAIIPVGINDAETQRNLEISANILFFLIKKVIFTYYSIFHCYCQTFRFIPNWFVQLTKHVKKRTARIKSQNNNKQGIGKCTAVAISDPFVTEVSHIIGSFGILQVFLNSSCNLTSLLSPTFGLSTWRKLFRQ